MGGTNYSGWSNVNPPKPKPIPADWWACACVKRHPDGRIKSIGRVSPKVKRCHRCGAERPEAPPPAGQPTEADA